MTPTSRQPITSPDYVDYVTGRLGAREIVRILTHTSPPRVMMFREEYDIHGLRTIPISLALDELQALVEDAISRTHREVDTLL
jgi:hypothetical protein